MSVPNLEHIVHQVRNSQAWDFTTQAGLCAYTNAVIVALHAADASFGHLVKTAGQNHCVDPQGRLHATDATLYKLTGSIVDFIQSAGYGTPPPANNVVWQEGPAGEYPASSWFAPVSGDEPEPPEPEPPEPEPPNEELEARVAALEQRMGELEQRMGELEQALSILAGIVTKNRRDAEEAIESLDRTTYKKGAMPLYEGKIGLWTITSHAKE